MYQNVSLWYMLAPSIGTYNVVVTWPSTVSYATAGALSLYGYAQIAPEASATSFNNAGATTTNITTLTNNALVVDMFGSGQDQGDLAPGSGQTQQFINAAGATTSGGASTKVVATAGATSMTWTQTGINRSAQVVAAFPLVNTFSGTVYTDEGVTNVGAGKTVRLIVNGASAGTAVTNASGGYSLTAAVSPGDALLLYIDGDPTYQGAAATILGNSNLTGLNIYAGHVITRQDNGGALSNANMGTAKGSYADTDILYSVSGSALTVSGTGTELYVPSGHSYTPGGNITTPALKSLGTFIGGSGTFDVNGDLAIAGGAFTSTSGNLYLAGNFSVTAGTFTHNSGTILFDGTSNASVTTGGSL